MNEAEKNLSIAQANHAYWLARTEMELPTPSTRTLCELGKAAFLLSQVTNSD